MFYHFIYPLHEYLSVLNVFRYITFRSAYATVTALFLCFVFGPIIIRKLKNTKVVQAIRDNGPVAHLQKVGTPTMGGLLILLAIIISTLLWADLTNRYIQILLLTTIWLGILGFIDDYLKVIKNQTKGLPGRYKICGQVLLGLIIGIILYFFPDQPGSATRTGVPFFKNVYIEFSWFYIPFVILIITSTANAVNLTDGLDGLAIGIIAFSVGAFAGLSYLSGHIKFSEYLNIQYIPGCGELTVFCAAVIGAALGFLWYNTHPAQIFMGDTGSQPLGGILGVIAILIKKELLLIIVGGIFVAEALSVIIQVISYKTTGKRVFKMTPLHHHFELKGWEESKVVVRFWIIAILLALVCLSTLKLR